MEIPSQPYFTTLNSSHLVTFCLLTNEICPLSQVCVITSAGFRNGTKTVKGA
jgi:hypothetical protein